MKRFLTCLCLVVMSLALCSGLAGAAEKVRINLLSTPFGTGSYVLGTALENIVNKGDYPILISHAETPGQAFNVNKLNADAAAAKTPWARPPRASTGWPPRARSPSRPSVPRCCSSAATPIRPPGSSPRTTPSNPSATCAASASPWAASPQAIWGYEPDALLRCGYSDDFYKSLSIQYVGTGEAATALVNGQVDAATIGGYMDPVSGKFSPAPQTVEVIASGRDLHHLDWTEDAVKKTAAKDIPLIPFSVPAHSVEGQTAPIFIGADTHGLFAHPDFPEEYAYILAKAMIENIDAFAQYHALGALMSREGLIKGWSPEQIHPGALRAYKEAGLL